MIPNNDIYRNKFYGKISQSAKMWRLKVVFTGCIDYDLYYWLIWNAFSQNIKEKLILLSSTRFTTAYFMYKIAFYMYFILVY